MTTLNGADSTLLICRTAETAESQKIMRETRDFHLLASPCLPIEPLGGLIRALISCEKFTLSKREALVGLIAREG